MKISEIVNKINLGDSSLFYNFTEKWIGYVTSRKRSIDISANDWSELFGRSNPVAGIDWGEMTEEASFKTKNGKVTKKTNEQSSFKEKWDTDIRPAIEAAINIEDSSEKLQKIKELSQLIQKVITDGGGRDRTTAINRMLTTFFPSYFVTIPSNENLIKFIDLLHQKIANGTNVIKADNWIDNSYQVKEFLDQELGDDNLTASAWRFYDYLKGDKQKDSIVTKEDTKATTSMDKDKYDDFQKLLLGNYNLILTGAPGTGKTYLAKKIAEAMGADEDSIKMVQFHPSYDYTDFIEGLRPIKEDDKLGFQRKDGVFKDFCKKALCDLNRAMMDSIEIAFKELWEKIRDGKITTLKLYSNIDSLPMIINPQKDNIIYFSQKGDSEKVSIGNEVSLAKVKKAFEECKITTVEKLRELGTKNRDRYGIGGSVSNMWGVMNYILESIEKNRTIASTKYPTPRKYVFIIDEINRGEVSKIFGELFYSIDSGYRGDKGTVETQYQNLIPKEGDSDFDSNNPDVFRNGFYVPENVYIIGTMNDIDRSVESMDFAIRRRFAWKEITAQSRQSMLDEDGAWKPYGKPSQDIIAEMKVRMDNLNDAIIDKYDYGTELLNKDRIGLSEAYQIGAAYFLKYALYSNFSNPFDELWNNHLKGLLYEYLRGKTNIDEKIERLHQAYNDTIKH